MTKNKSKGRSFRQYTQHGTVHYQYKMYKNKQLPLVGVEKLNHFIYYIIIYFASTFKFFDMFHSFTLK